jgi:phage shock protein PspC (stress-responsive transcriptional regulator)
MFAGVCGGIAEYLDVDPTLVRLFFVALTLLSGGQGLLIYIVLMLVVPEQPKEKQKDTPGESSDDSEPAIVRSSTPIPTDEPSDTEEA